MDRATDKNDRLITVEFANILEVNFFVGGPGIRTATESVANFGGSAKF